MARKQHRQPVSTEVVYYFHNQNTTTFCIILCLCHLRGLRSSLTTQSWYQHCLQRQVVGFHSARRQIVGFIVFLVQACSPHLRQLTLPRPPPASPLVGIQLLEVDCCLSLKHTLQCIKQYNLPPRPNIPPPPIIHHSPHHGLQCPTIAQREQVTMEDRTGKRQKRQMPDHARFQWLREGGTIITSALSEIVGWDYRTKVMLESVAAHRAPPPYVLVIASRPFS